MWPCQWSWSSRTLILSRHTGCHSYLGWQIVGYFTPHGNHRRSYRKPKELSAPEWQLSPLLDRFLGPPSVCKGESCLGRSLERSACCASAKPIPHGEPAWRIDGDRRRGQYHVITRIVIKFSRRLLHARAIVPHQVQTTKLSRKFNGFLGLTLASKSKKSAGPKSSNRINYHDAAAVKF